MSNIFENHFINYCLGKNKNVFLMIYFFVFFIVMQTKKKQPIKHFKFPNLKLKKSGIFFISNLTHRIKIHNMKTLFVDGVLYLKTKDKIVRMLNVNDVKIWEGYLYFTALGKVEIVFNADDIYRYFSIKIKSNKFNFEDLKQFAITDLINNEFNINFSKILKKYINIIENVLKIRIFSKKIIISQNKLKLPFEVIYKLNNKIKRVKVNNPCESIVSS